MKPITGTFIDEITCDIPSQNWSFEDWRTEFATMREAGIDTVILIRACFRDMAIYPSEAMRITDVPDLASLFLDEAQRHGMSLFFGSYDDGLLGHEWKSWQPVWEAHQRLIPEIWRRCGSHPAFKGWYVSPETCIRTEGSLALYPRVSGLMKETADLPVLISPGWPSYLYKDLSPHERHARFIEEWSDILSRSPAVDIVAFQDGSCSYDQKDPQVFELEDYLRETSDMCAALGKTLWQNIETFSWKFFPRDLPVIDWRQLRRKMEVASRWAEKLITFEFSHFLSPNSMWPAARKLHERYRSDILGR